MIKSRQKNSKPFHNYKERKEASSRLIRRFFLTIVLFLFYLIFSEQVSKPLEMGSGVMSPAVKKGERFLYSPILLQAHNQMSYLKFGGLSRGDILVIQPPYFRSNQRLIDTINPLVRFFSFQKLQFSSYSREPWEASFLVKRLVALPGDTVKIDHYNVLVKPKGSLTYFSQAKLDKKVYYPFIDTQKTTRRQGSPLDGTVPPYTLKENEYYVLNDNRGMGNDSLIWGPLSKGNIKGKVFFRYWPLDRIGPL